MIRNIKSVISQTYINYEHIIVDDGNDPETEKLVNEFNDCRIVLLKHDYRRGAAASYNTGIKASKGEFITFLDDDDEYLPTYLEKMNKRFSTSGKNCGFIWSGIERVLDSEHGEKKLAKIVWPSVFRKDIKGMIAATSIGNGFGVCVRKQCIDVIGLYDETLSVAEDTDFLIRLCKEYEFQSIPEVLVRIHSHESDQLTRNENFKERIKGKETILRRHKLFFEKTPRLFIEHYRGYAGLCYKSGFKRKGRNALKEIILKSPLSLVAYLDFIMLEMSGKYFSETAFVKRIRRAVISR